jgi:hypothetical protein
MVVSYQEGTLMVVRKFPVSFPIEFICVTFVRPRRLCFAVSRQVKCLFLVFVKNLQYAEQMFHLMPASFLPCPF